MHERKQSWILDTELHVGPPSLTQHLDRVAVRVRARAGDLGGDPGGDLMLCDRLDDALLVAEQAVDRRRLHPGSGLHGACRDRLATAIAQKACRREHDSRSRVSDRG